MMFLGFFHIYDLGVSYTFHFRKNNYGILHILILNCKENKETGAICFEIKVPRKKNLLQIVAPKIYESNFIMEKHTSIFWFVNRSQYHHREMGLMWKF